LINQGNDFFSQKSYYLLIKAQPGPIVADFRTGFEIANALIFVKKSETYFFSP